MFDTLEALIAAKHLCGIKGIEVVNDLDHVCYYHVLFDTLQPICSNGAWTKPVFPGQFVLRGLPPRSIKQIFALFPKWRGKTTALVQRHIKSDQLLLQIP